MARRLTTLLASSIRDSPLTAHGVLQARRLGSHLAARSSTIGPVTHVFSSDLQRAVNTAQAIVDAQSQTQNGDSAIPRQERVRLVRIADLRERDFGSAEGKRYGTPHADAESHEAMRARADRFVRACLAPLLHRRASHDGMVVVVSHGLLLNQLLRGLLMRFAPAEMARLPAARPGLPRSEYLASWGNTGYLEMAVSVSPLTIVRPSGGLGSVSSAEQMVPGAHQQRPISLAVHRVNALQHLEGLRKTRGGIGNARFDTRQRTMDTFLAPVAKKRKADED